MTERRRTTMLAKTMQDALNEQIQKEYHSSYLYLAMAAYCEASNLPGSAQWMRIQSQEELAHAMKLFEHMVDRGGRVTLQAIPQPLAEYKSALDVFENVLAHEQLVTASIHKLYALALKENDYPGQVMLQWFVTEQVEEEKNAGQVVEQLKAIGESKNGLFMVDRGLGKRGAK
jgi:ferritin